MINSDTPSREALSSRQTKGESSCESTDSPNHVAKASGVNHAVSPAISLNNGREQLKTETKSNQSGNESCGNTKPNCYKCAHRGTVPGDAHSECNHPMALEPNSRMSAVFFMMQCRRGPLEKRMNISYNKYGFSSGWFMWPMNFDPVWLETCDGFKEKEND